jgi:hypothetical protein
MRASNLLWPVLLAQNAIAITVDTTSAGKHLDICEADVEKTNKMLHDRLHKKRRKHRSPRPDDFLQWKRNRTSNAPSQVSWN